MVVPLIYAAISRAHHLHRELAVTEPRQGDAAFIRKLADERFHLDDYLRGKNQTAVRVSFDPQPSYPFPVEPFPPSADNRAR